MSFHILIETSKKKKNVGALHLLVSVVVVVNGVLLKKKGLSVGSKIA